MLVVKDIVKTLHHPFSVISNFNYHFTSGTYCLKGPNGCGKSTLLKILAGIDRTYSGSVHLNKVDNKKQNQTYKRIMTYLPDQPTFFIGTPAIEVIKILCGIRKTDFRPQLEKYSTLFKMYPYLHQPIESLSLGQRKKIFLSATLIQELPLWLLDEPTNGLDDSAMKLLAQEISDRKNSITIFSSHSEEFIQMTQAKIIEMELVVGGHFRPTQK